MLTRERYISDIAERLSWVTTSVELKNSLNLYDINIHAESFFCELLNLIFGYQLENLNHSKKNFDSIDLGDRESRIAVQITSQDTRAKVQETLDKFIENGHETKYNRLIVLIIGTKPQFRKPFNVASGFCFDADTDVWDTAYLMNRINEKPVQDLLRIFDFFREQLYPNEGYTGSGLNELGAQMLSEMHSKCIAKLLSIGIAKETASQIISEDIESNKYQYILDEVEQGKQYLVGEFGSGKSHVLLIIAQRLMNKYLSGNSLVFPLYVQGKEIARIGSVKRWLEDKKLDKASYHLFIDGLDEIERSLAVQLIEEIKFLSIQHPQGKILVASRPLTILNAEATFYIRPFTDEECFSLYNIVSDSNQGEEAFCWTSEALRKTLSKPFFCIVFALLKSEPKGWAKQDIDLVIALVARTIEKNKQDVKSTFTDLANIASKAVDRDYGDVHISEINFSGNIEKVLETGFITLSNDYISFPLPIIAQWMAAEAIRHRIVDIDGIISNNRRMNKWLYPLSILFSQISFEESLELFSKIVRKSPGIASRIIRDGIRLDSMASLPDVYECGENLRQTMQIWVDALGPLSNWIAPLDHGKIRPLGLNIEQSSITYSWLRPEYDTQPVQALSFDDLCERGNSIRCHYIPAQATWPWFISFDYLAGNLKEAVQNHTIIPNEGQLQEEYLWSTLLHIAGKGSFYEEKLDLTQFEQYRQFIGHIWIINGKEVSADFLFDLLDKRIEAGNTTIAAPYPTSDKPATSGLVWSGYSAQRLLEKVQFVYGSAIDEYMRMVDSAFISLQNSLRTAILFPFKLVGKLKFSKDSATWANSPQLAWYIEALPKSERTCVDIQLVETQLNPFNIFNSLFQNNLRLRPDAEIEDLAHIDWGHVDIFKSTPVTNIVFSWLENELKSIGWI